MALLLRLRRTRTRTRTDTFTNPILYHHLYSTSNNAGNDDQPPSDSNTSISSKLSEVTNTLKSQSPGSSNSKQEPPIKDILKNFRTFAPQSNDPSQQPKQISFHDMYLKRSNRSVDSNNTGVSMDAIRKSLRKMDNRKGVDLSLKTSPGMTSGTGGIGGTYTLPESVFGREMRERKGGVGSVPSAAAAMNLEYMRKYEHNDMGEKLKKLRPEVKGNDWFSIGELNERLKKLREMDVLESKSSPIGSFTSVMRQALTNIAADTDDKSKKPSLHKVDMLALLGGTPTYLTKPPKEHLVEKYFHPDNMSAAEKMKVELAKVRDEFKMSESDCGSARVQVATLTTKIKHLSSTLHKKDVHSRKGLMAMVQQRKKLLKYLRRTDWDSYCFVISKLGLRDNPEYSYKTRTGKPGDSADKRARQKQIEIKKKGKKKTQVVEGKLTA